MKSVLPYLRPFLIASIIMLVQPSFSPGGEPDFDKLWKEADHHRSSGLPKSALEVLETIRLKAIEANNRPQLLKTVIYRVGLTQEIEEDHLKNAIDFATGQLNLMQSPEKEILHSVIAELYWFYYQQNRHLLLDRTSLMSNQSGDLAEWDMPRLRKAILDHYQASLLQKEILQKTAVENYGGIILFEKESNVLQPYLYDFLAHRALDFYTTDEAGLTVPGRAPDFIHPSSGKNRLFAPIRDFVRDTLPKGEYKSSRALRLYQELHFFHLGGNQPEVLAFNELKRLKLALQLSEGLPNHEQDYLTALERLQNDMARFPVSTLIAYDRAAFLIGHEHKPVPFEMSDQQKFALREARTIAINAISTFPDSEGAKQCRMLVAQVEQKEIGLQIQRVDLPDTPLPVRLSYRNVQSPSFRLVSVSTERLEKIIQGGDPQKQLLELKAIEPIKKWSLELPFEDDFREHSAIIDLPPLPIGLYVLLASSDDSFSDSSIVEYTSFQISRLSFISSRSDSRHNFYLLDRETGKAVGNADIRVMNRDWDRKGRKYVVSEILRLKTAKDGSFVVGFDQIPDNKFFYIEAGFKGDNLLSDRFFDTYKRNREQKTELRTWFFTDRAIYRPGQAVYFKGIMLQSKGAINEAAVDRKTSVKLFDANHQEIESLELKTNEFGSFEGSFVVPAGGLNGQFRLSNENGSTTFSVEEYKRPSFEVKLEQPYGQVKLGTEVEIKGSAAAFAGYPISNAGFSYRIMRETRFPFWRSWIPIMSGPPVLVSTGEGETHTDGSFLLSFTAWPDTDSQRHDPVFHYTVMVDVTDKNGEMRSSTITVAVGSKALLLSADFPEIFDRSTAGQYRFFSKNLQQQAVDIPVTIKISRLAPQQSLFRESVLAAVDRMVPDSNRLATLFPMDDFYNRHSLENRGREVVFVSKQVTTGGSAPLFTKETSGWPQGNYLLEMETVDEFGQTVQFSRFFTLIETASKTIPEKQLGWFHIEKDEALPGQTIEYQIGSAAPAVRALVEVFVNNKLAESSWHTLNNAKKNLKFAVDEEHRGTIRIQMSFVRFNRLIQYSKNIKVPFTNKMLDITLETKRDNLIPGAAETWKLSVSGKDSSGLVAEMLASMYDASLDQFRPHSWGFDLLRYPFSAQSWSSDNGFTTFSSIRISGFFEPRHEPPHFVMPPQLNWFGFQPYGYHWRGSRGMPLTMSKSKDMSDGEAMPSMAGDTEEIGDTQIFMLSDEALGESKEETKPQGPKTMVRRNFNETAFFYPQLTTDADGRLSFSFTLPDALTRWKLMLLAHTTDLKTGMAEHSFSASKPFMIVPNTPRFYREGDTAWVSARVVNTGTAELTGLARLEVRDAPTDKKLDYLSELQKPILKLAPGLSQEVSWKLIIGESSSLLSLLFTASADGFSDAEQQWIPVLSRKVLVTETKPLRVGANSKQNVVLEGLSVSGTNMPHQLVVEFTSNPAWYAVQALPYLASPEYESADNLFNRFYANRLAAHIANSIPGLMEVVNTWKAIQPDAFLSNLEKNQELKGILLQETPWLMDAKDETVQKRNISLLFDLNRMRYEESQSLKQLTQLQLGSGGWSWFKGMPENRFTTQQIVTGLGKLKHLGLLKHDDHLLKSSIARAIRFLDAEMQEDFDKLKKWKSEKTYVISPLHLQYLYARSFFADIPLNNNNKEAFGFFLNSIESGWLGLNPGLQAMAALTVNRQGNSPLSEKIMKSLLERSIVHPELGRYWKQSRGYYWHEAPVESQALLIEAFEALTKEKVAVDEMKTWLLSQKQTHRWPGSRATAEAVYALLLRGSDWLSTSGPVKVSVGGKTVDTGAAEAGTGYVRQRWSASEITPAMAGIEMENPNPYPAWGGAYWQYFVPIDQLKPFETPLSINKEVFLEKPGNGEIVLVPATAERMKPGDRIRVRLVISSDRDMEYIHLRDYRAAAFEPLDLLSGYRYQGGLGYYMAIKDASTDFFIAHLPRGTYVFEYSLVVGQRGDFANGHATIQCLYAPEFSARSKGGRVSVGK